MEDAVTLTCPALGKARVVGFRGTERISAPYEIAIDAIVPRGEDDLEAALLAPLTLTFDRGDGDEPLRWNGVIAAVDAVEELADAALCTILLVPHLWKLTLTHHSRIFVDETTPKILEAVLKENGLAPADYDLRLAGTYKPREHVCQYLESDFAFLSRWMEREGLYYFFEHGEERERLIITDSAAFQQDFTPDPVRFVPQARGEQTFKRTESLDAFACRQGAAPSRVRLQDYDYNRPDLEMTSSADVAPRGFGEVRVFGDNFATLDEARRLATVRAQEIGARRKIFHGSGNVRKLRSGYTFTLDEHPRPSYNASYLVTAIEHVVNQSAHALHLQDVLGYTSDELYRSSIVAIPATTQFRPERTTLRPQIDGLVTATIDGPADSKYAQIDKQGRYKVRVSFDEGDLADGKASMFVRMLQPHGGSAEGFHFPLRKGTEVQLLFLGGDADRPVIAGVAHNAQTPSVVTGDNHTKNVIHTGGNNRIEMEDSEDKQHVKLSTPTKNTFFRIGGAGGQVDDLTVYDTAWSSDGSALLNTAENFDIQVGGHQETAVDKYKRETVHGDLTETFHKDQTTNVLVDQQLTVNGTRTTRFGKLDETVEKEALLTYKERTQYVGGTNAEHFVGPSTFTHSALRTLEALNGSHETTNVIL